MYERFTDRSRKVMQLANQEAQRFNHEYIGTEHILLGLVKEGAGVAANVLTNLGLDLRKIQQEVEKIVQSGPDMVTMGKLPQTPRAKKVIDYAMEEARNLNHNYVGTEHLLLGLLREEEGVGAQVLVNLGLNLEDVRDEVLNMLGQAGHVPEMESIPPEARVAVPAKKSGRAPLLASCGADRTEAVRQGVVPGIIGRHDEIGRVIRILSCRQHSNPILIGEPGAGKTAIITGVAERFVRGEVPPALADHRIILLDLPHLVTSSEDFTACVKNIKSVVREVRKAGNIILFIDDIHALPRMSEACSLLIVALARGEVRCIAATSTAEYQQYIASDSIFRRCFQPVLVQPASAELTLEILRRLRHPFEVHHQVDILEEGLPAVIEQAAHLQTARALPDRAIDLLDEAAAYVRLKAQPPVPNVRVIDTQIEQLLEKKEKAVAAQDFERAADLRDQADKLKSERERALRDVQQKSGKNWGVVDARVLAEVVAEINKTALR